MASRGSASRLYTKVREERGLAYSVYSSLSPGRYGSSYLVGLQTRVVAVDEAVRLVKDELARMARDPVTARELELAKSYLIGSYPLRTDTSDKLAGLLVAVEDRTRHRGRRQARGDDLHGPCDILIGHRWEIGLGEIGRGASLVQRAVLKYFRTYSLFSTYQRLPRCPPYGYSFN